MRAAVLGSPISHSLSPVLHRAAYAELGLDWTYDAIECDEAHLPGVLARLDAEWAGLSLTMPLKSAVLGLLDDVSPLGQAVGAVNTVVPRAGGWVGENTDVPGLVEVLDGAGFDQVDSALILGGGATARSAVAALGVITRRVAVLLRTPDRGPELEAVGAEVGVQVQVVGWESAAEAIAAAPLVVATTPAGATDGLPGGAGTLIEVVYDPWPTPLAERWHGPVVGGLELLVQQAALQVELMTGAGAPVEEMREAGLAALAARG
jgi:shikimate dehydrogenase